MPLPVIPSVYRITLNFATNIGVAPKCVLHVGLPSSTASAVAAGVKTALLAQPNMWRGMNTVFSVDTIDCLPLDGVSSTTTIIGSSSIAGNETGDFIPEACMVVKHATTQRGSRGRGRTFVGPIAEAAIANGTVEASRVTACNTAWNAFPAALNTALTGLAFVVASYAHSDWNAVTSSTARSAQATQRRRLLQQR